ncbi:hypothetical protein H9Q74_007607 [Fusarium xylarioides]|nr:hypothetical protein H9Q74_007607 [Fusarium xylarioides]
MKASFGLLKLAKQCWRHSPDDLLTVGDVEQSRRDRKKAQGYTKEIVGGVMNGIAASAVAGVMGGLMCTVM